MGFWGKYAVCFLTPGEFAVCFLTKCAFAVCFLTKCRPALIWLRLVRGTSVSVCAVIDANVNSVAQLMLAAITAHQTSSEHCRVGFSTKRDAGRECVHCLLVFHPLNSWRLVRKTRCGPDKCKVLRGGPRRGRPQRRGGKAVNSSNKYT